MRDDMDTLELTDSPSHTSDSLHADKTHPDSLHPDSANPKNPPSLREAVRLYPKVVVYLGCLTSAIMLWGYDLVIVGSINSVPSFQRDFGELYNDEWIIPSRWLSLWMAFGPLGSLFGAIAGGAVQDRIGRRLTLTAGSTVASIAVAILFSANQTPNIEGRRGMFLAGKTVQGFAVGMIKTLCLTYVSENAPTSLRGSAMALFPTATLLGQLVGSLVVFAVESEPSARGYTTALASQWVFSVAPFCLSLILPESPAWLVRRGRVGEARRSARRLFSAGADANLERIRADVAAEDALSAQQTFRACFDPANRRRTGIVVFAGLLPTAFGLNLLSSGSYFLQQCGVGSRTSLIFLIAGIVVGMLANVASSVAVLPRVGRRRAMLAGTSAAGLLWGAMGVSGAWPGEATGLAAGVIMHLVIVACGLSCWPASYAVMGETSSLRMRAKTQAVGGVFAEASSILMDLVLPFVFNPDAGHAGPFTGFVFAGLCAVGVGLVWLWVPEMKGRSVGEINEMFARGLSARAFRGWPAGK